MVKKDLVVSKLAELALRIARVETRTTPSASALASDIDALDIVSFNLMLAVQACADVAAHIVTEEGWAPARSLAEGFNRLVEHRVLQAPTAESLKRAVGLRNVVAHGYGRVDPDLVFVAATSGLADLRAFANEVSAWLALRP
jgi:uncharacterized protein YutE (UPF0331/DUF86 family)